MQLPFMKKNQKTVTLWKSMQAGMKSLHGSTDWQIGKWEKEKTAEACETGFHASERIIDAMEYVNLEVLTKVEVRGKSDIESDKQCWSEMRIVDAWTWKKENSVRLAIFAAELVIENFKREFPKDDRPRKAIEAAKRWLKKPTESAAKSAAESAAWSAESAAWSAAESAAWSARSAAESAAESAAWSAASKRISGACDKFIQDMIPTLERYRPAHTPENIDSLRDDEVFVFGSNAEGNHAGGTAKTAVKLFGAVEGRGEGLQGQSYALPTMTGLKDMKGAIKRFVSYAKETPGTWFYVTKIGTGIAGHTEKEVAALFPKKLPENITMPIGWTDLECSETAKSFKQRNGLENTL